MNDTNIFEPIVNADMLATQNNYHLRNAIVGIIVANTALSRRVNVADYDAMINMATIFAESSTITVLKDDKPWKTFSFGYNDDMRTCGVLQDLVAFVNNTKAYFEDTCGANIDGTVYTGFCYQANIGKISFLVYDKENNDDALSEWEKP